MKKLLLLFFISCSFWGFSQNISGYVRDSLSGENLIGAYIFTQDFENAAISNEFGFFSLSLSEETQFPCKIIISYIGYKDLEITLKSKPDKGLYIKLIPNTTLNTVVVERKVVKQDVVGLVEVPIQQIQTLPMLGGEVNIMRAMQLLPGVGAGSEGKSDLYVRGGTPDQNLILLDDVPIYYINHLGGFVSVFDANAISGFSFYKGSFPAKYGSRLSSVIDIRMKEGNMKEYKTKINIGILSSKVSTEGPIKKDTSSYMISFRRSLYDMLTAPVVKISNPDSYFGYYFYDVHAKYNHILNQNNRLYVSYFRGYDKVKYARNEKDDGFEYYLKNSIKWGNELLAIRLNHMFSDALFLNITGYYTKFSFDEYLRSYDKMNDYVGEEKLDFLNQVRDFAVKTDFDFYKNKWHIRTGTHHTYHEFLPNEVTHFLMYDSKVEVDTAYNENATNSFENTFYLDNTYSFNTFNSIRFGVRTSSYSVTNSTFYSFEPRILFYTKIKDFCNVKAYWGTSTQFVHFLRSPELFFTSDSWMPATKETPPQTSQLASIGVSKNFKKFGTEVTLEGYYKEMNNLLEYGEKENVFLNNYDDDWKKNLAKNGKGTSQGFEVMIHKKEGKYNGWVAYTLAKTTRQFDSINNGKMYLYDFDTKHSLAVVFNYEFSKNVIFSATWVYYSGRVFTSYTSKVESYIYSPTEPGNIVTTEVYLKPTKNNVRMDPYHRLDLNIQHTKIKNDRERIWSFGVYNAYNRVNAFGYEFLQTPKLDSQGFPTQERSYKLFKIGVFPIIPSVSFAMEI